MKGWKHKWVLCKFLEHEYKGFEKYLENMALKGWKLKTIKGCLLRFERIERKALKYIVEFKEYCKAADWEFICKSGELQIYCSEDEKESISSYNSEEERFKRIAKASLKNILISISLGSLFSLNLYSLLGGNRNISFLANNLSIAVVLFIMIFILELIVVTFDLIVCYIKLKIKIKKNEGILYNNLKILNLKVALNTFMLRAVVAIIVYSIVFDKNIILGIMALSIIGYISILNFFTKYIDRKNLIENERKRFKVLGTISIFIASVTLISILISASSMFAYVKKEQIKSIPLTLSNFGYNNLEHENKYVYEDKSVIAYNLEYSELSEKESLDYELFESKYEWAVNYEFNKMIKLLKSCGIMFEYIKTLDNGVKVYKDDDMKSYIFVSKHKLIKIQSCNQNTSEKDIIDIVYKNVFNN